VACKKSMLNEKNATGLISLDQAFNNIANYPLLFPHATPQGKHFTRLKTYEKSN
jgi:hypothetical protein